MTQPEARSGPDSDADPDVDALVVDPAQAGLRLDRFLAGQLVDMSRSRAARLIRDHAVTVDGAPATPARLVAAGARVEVRMPPPPPALEPEPGPLRVVLATDDFIAVDKPPGCIMHPGAGRERGTLAHRLVARYPELATLGHGFRPGIVHRLDKDTSGIVVVARRPSAYRWLTRAFAQRAVAKAYLLLVRGTPSASAATIDAPIGRDPQHRTRMAIVVRGRPASTAYDVLASGPDVSLVVARPATGRTHQIRVHLASIGHPIVGDQRYGARRTLAARSMLHAWTLEFSDPDGAVWTLSAAPAPDLAALAAGYGFALPSTPSSGSHTP